MGEEEGGGRGAGCLCVWCVCGGGWGGEEGSLSTYEHMGSFGPGEVNTMNCGHCVGRGGGQ